MVVKTLTKDEATVRLDISGMHCASCVGRIERYLSKVPGVDSAAVNLATNTASVTYDPLIASPDTLIATVVKSGYGATPATDDLSAARKPLARPYESYNLLAAIVLTVPVLIISMAIKPETVTLEWIVAALATVVVFVSGREFFSGAFSALVHGGAATMDTLIAVGSFSAYSFSLYELVFVRQPMLYFETAATIVTLILFGRQLEARARKSAADSMQSLSKELPATASKIAEDGSEQIVPVGKLLAGDQIRIHPGEKLAADGVVVSGASAVNESLVTGESLPVEKTVGSRVIGGTLNTGGTFIYRITAVGAKTVLASIVALVQEAQGSKAPIQRVADKVSAVFVPSVFFFAALTFIVRLLLLKDGFSEALIPSVAVLVIACPCALGLATPTAIMVSSGRGAQLGVLIKNGSVLELAQAIKTIIFDKTGTLTEGTITLSEITPLGSYDRAELLHLAGSSEVPSEHPLAKAIVSEAKSAGVKLVDAESFTSHWGQGVKARVDGREILIGNTRLMKNSGVDLDETIVGEVFKLKESGSTTIIMAVDNLPAALFSFSDTIRTEAKSAVLALQKLGINVMMLTGDSAGPASAIAEKIGIENFRADLLPADKASAIEELTSSSDGVVAMVGDGVNDAPALAAADIGIAMGHATDMALNAADITLIRGDLGSIQTAIALSKSTMTIIRQNLFWAFIFNIIGIPLAAFGVLNPMLAAFAMALSSVTVVTNSLRLKTLRLGSADEAN